MSDIKEENSSKCKPFGFVGILLAAQCALALVGVCVILGPDDTQFHLARANNIIRGWKCPRGGYANGANQNGDCLCVKCPLGFKCAGGTDPKRRCGLGAYQDVKGQDTCKPSPPGHYNPKRGSPRAIPCPYGHYQKNSGKQQCRAASPGHFVGQRGQTRQRPCPVQTYQNLRGQKSCKPAPPGTYVNKKGQSRGTQCPYGYYQDTPGQSTCKRSRPGHVVSKRGSKSQTRCPLNTYQACYGQIACVPCDIGSITVRRGSTKCVPMRQNGQNCNRQGECVSNFCCKGKCAPMNTCDTLTAPDGLRSNPGFGFALKRGSYSQQLLSENRRYRAIMQSDGNFVVYSGKKSIYATGNKKYCGTKKNPGTFLLAMQPDNNLVKYCNGVYARWASRTANKGAKPARIVMQNDGNLVMYDARNKPIWSTKTAGVV